MENKNTHFTFNDFFLKATPFMRYVKKYCSAEEITDENTLRRKHFVRCVTQATNTHLDYVILIAFPIQERLRERSSILRLYVHCHTSSYVLLKTSYQFR